MTKTPKRPRDTNQLAKMIVGIATGDVSEPVADESPKARAARAGGNARKNKLDPARRSEIATTAAKKRWDSHD